ncbi:glycosyltransferase family 2 protein [Pikeienuella piscinae]|uniref:Glycosyltransferase family 2 protein n=1 Tax=Pikeienuella piscinae TaxID=2748098 RepID=A0A7L5BXQ2_9RHOB|nr:glycosyltransferase family 2 protein [Pikeienuella piscinae]QIE56211.1 glycosyltransferase family 2 protein [Pikeienuella piscinae]
MTAARSLSVVIPFYRDEVYLEAAVTSAVAQPIDDLEVIVVNDNPGPSSAAFLSGIAARHPIRVIAHAENRGLAAARNTGIDAAEKEFVTFIDADDVFIAGALAKNLAFAARSGADLTHAPTLLLPVDRLHPIPLRRDELLFGRRNSGATFEEAPEAQYIVSSWSSIYRRDFLVGRGVRFDEAQRRFEDRLFVLEAVFSAKKIAFSDIPARIWRRRLGSITTGEREIEDVAMQLDLLTKCVARARAYAGAEGDRSMALQRELHHSICRVIWEVRALDHDPRQSPALDGARARLTAAISGLKLRRKVFADLPTMKISPLDKSTRNHGPVSRAKLMSAYDMVAAGRWDALYDWRRAQVLKPAIAATGPTMDMELILHIGLHKTGSTYLQRVLERDSERLKALGLLVPETGFLKAVADNRRGAATPGHVGFFGAIRSGDGAIFERLRAECVASGCSRVLISAENLSLPFHGAADRAFLMRRAAAGFGFLPRRQVIAVFRRPDEYVERYWREHVFLATGWARRTAEEFAAELGPQMADLTCLTADWRKFANGALELIGYETVEGASLLERFYAALGVPPPPDPPEGVIYPSPRAEQAIAGRMIALARLDKRAQADAFAEFLAATAALPAIRGLMAIPAEARLRLIERFEERSAPLLRSIGVAPPIEGWRRDVEAAPAPEAFHPGYLEAALRATANAPTGGFTPTEPPLSRRLYRLGRGVIDRFR